MARSWRRWWQPEVTDFSDGGIAHGLGTDIDAVFLEFVDDPGLRSGRGPPAAQVRQSCRQVRAARPSPPSLRKVRRSIGLRCCPNLAP